jgi:hypothetical protein
MLDFVSDVDVVLRTFTQVKIGAGRALPDTGRMWAILYTAPGIWKQFWFQALVLAGNWSE